MVRKKSFTDRVIAFAAAMVFSMTMLLLFPAGTFIATAEESTTVTAQEAGMNITGVIELNGSPLTSGTEVRNGDVISLDVNWTLPNDFEYVNGTFTYDLTGKLYGISLADIIIPVGNTAIYQVKNNVLYIKLLTGHSNRYGSCSLSGSINVSQNDVGNNGEFSLQFIGTPSSNTTSVPVIVTDYVAGLVVNKTASGGVVYENGQYYQSFNILVHSNNQASEGVTISDIMGEAYDYSQITDFTVKRSDYNNPTVDYTITNNSDGFDITFNEPIGTEWNEQINISYKVPVDVHGVINSSENKVNTVTATATGQQPKTDTAESNIYEPSISKNGTYDPATGKIEWTITVFPGTVKDEFVITELPGTNLDEDELKTIFGDDLKISSSELNLSDGKYVYTYETTATSDPVVDKAYSNSAKVEFDNITEEYTTNEVSVKVPKSIGNFVTKTYGDFNPDGTLPWTITVDLPDVDVTNIEVTDRTDNNNNVMDSSKFTVSGINGTGGTLTPVQGVASNTDIGYVVWIGSQINFHINDAAFLAANKGQPITINYDMTIPDGATTIKNTADVSLTITGAPNPISSVVTTEFAPDFTASKYTTADTSQFPKAADYHFPVVWGVRIDGDEHFQEGDVIVVEDTLPDGIEFVADSVIVNAINNDNGYGTNYNNLLQTSVSGNNITFTLTLSQDIIDAINQYNTDPNNPYVMPIRIIYLTYVADDEIPEIYQNNTGTYTNSATVEVNNQPVGSVSAEKVITPATGDVVTKTAAKVVPGSEDPNDANAYADYTIEINPDAVKLTNGTTITAQDTLGSNLTLVGNPIISPDEGTDCDYDEENGILNFTLKDSTAYTITYRVVVETIGKNDDVPENQLTDMFGNTIVVDVAGVTDFNTSSPYTEIYYRSEADYSSDEQERQITIKGTKSWAADSKDSEARPSKIEIELTAHYYDTNGNKIDEKTVSYDFTVPDGQTSWEYTIPNLPTYISNTGTTIEYDVSEVKADGYDISYPDGTVTEGITKVGDTKEFTVNITNTFTPATTEVGSLTVNKSWVGDTAGDRPEIQITVVDVSGNGNYSQTKTLEGTSVTFENLPLYTYSRNNNDELVRELRQYSITESVVDANEQSKLANYELTKSYVGDYFTLTGTIQEGFKLTSAVEQTLTNTLKDPAKTSVSVEKVWNDGGNRDNKRPASVTINLLADGAAADTVTLEEANGWEYTFTDLAKYRANGVDEIVYTITEDTVADYTTVITGTAADGFTVTNSYTPEVTAVTVTKEWQDAGNQDGIRPDKITVTLKANGTDVGEYELTETDNWTLTVPDLPKNDGGTPIEYTWAEAAVNDYELTGNVTTGTDTILTNTHTPELTNITVTKNWDDANDQDGIRPDKITVTLKANGTDVDEYELTEADNWTLTVSNLPKNNGGTAIEYTWSEDTVPSGYTLTSNTTTGTDTIITNSHTAEETSVAVKKVWNDNNDQDGKRPESLTVKLLADGNEYATFTLDVSNAWYKNVENLPKNNAGTAIVYTWEEVQVADYSSSSAVEGALTTFTNSHTPESTSLTVIKNWNDGANQDGIRPSELKVTLSNGTEVTLNDQNNWTATINNLPVYANGQKINYSWTEDTIPAGYTLESNTTTDTVTTITNKHIPEITSATVIKEWDDADNQDGIRPAELKVTLSNGTEVTLNESNNWTATVENLPKYADGQEIIYTWTEDTLPTGYTYVGSTVNGTSTTITNKHTPEVIDITVTKDWDDANNQDGKRPNKITVNLLADGNPVTSQDISAADGWTYTFTGLAKFDDGVEIAYTVTEETVADYTPEISGFDIKNTHTPETVSISGSKTWDDDSDRDGKRPDKITVNLLADSVKINSVDVTEADGWAYSFDNLPKYNNGTEIVYTISENPVADYTTVIDGYNITNTHEPAKISLTGTKSWDDNGHTNVVRPASITVNLHADGRIIASATATEQTNWQYTFNDLYKFDGGEEIEYTVSEEIVTDFTPEYNGINITNKYTPDLTSIQVIKNWNDDGNRDGKRPENVTVRLLADGNEVGTAVLSAENGWKHIFTGLAKTNGNADIVYTVTEDAVPDYTSNVDGFNITNSYTPERTSVTVSKTWDDDSNRDGKRPASITVNLLANGTRIASETVTAEDGWECTFDNLYVKENGQDIRYTVTEAPVDGYATEINGYSITNSYTPETIDISGTKSWLDNNNAEGKRPASITVRLLANGAEVGFKSVTESDGWAYEFADMPKYANGSLITYTIKEDPVADYTALISGYNITNRINPVVVPVETIDINVTKTWDDNNDAAAVRPSALEITLKRDGTVIRTMSADWVKNVNKWTYTFTDLPKYPDGSTTAYVYTVEEEDLSAIGYTGSSASTPYNFNFVNTYTDEPDDEPVVPDEPTEPTPPTPPTPSIPSTPPVSPKPPYITPVKPFIPKDPEDVSSESGAEMEAETIGNVDTTSYSFIAILLAVSIGGIVFARRKQKQK